MSEPAPDRPTVLIGAPHTSNWDFVLMLGIAWEAGLPLRWLGKHTLFRGAAGPLMRALGGIPVDRRDPAGLYVVAGLSPGLYAYMYGEGDDQKVTALWAGPAPAPTPKDAVPLGRVDPVTMSEAVHDLLRSAS